MHIWLQSRIRLGLRGLRSVPRKIAPTCDSYRPSGLRNGDGNCIGAGRTLVSIRCEKTLKLSPVIRGQVMVEAIQPARRRVKVSAYAKLFGSGDLDRSTRCAIVVAHPGDEIVGAGYLISKLDDVHILYVTDGADEQTTKSIAERTEYAETRKRECKSALALANVPAHRVIDLGLPVHKAAQHLPDLTRTIAAFLQSSGADIVMTHPYEGGHPDHDATAFATHAALRLMTHNGFRPPVAFEIALHPSADGTTKVPDFLPAYDWETATLVLDDAASELKHRMIDCLVTQRECLKASPGGPERFRKSRKYDFTAPPQPGALYYEKFCSTMGSQDWQSLASEALAELFPAKHSN